MASRGRGGGGGGVLRGLRRGILVLFGGELVLFGGQFDYQSEDERPFCIRGRALRKSSPTQGHLTVSLAKVITQLVALQMKWEEPAIQDASKVLKHSIST